LATPTQFPLTTGRTEAGGVETLLQCRQNHASISQLSLPVRQLSCRELPVVIPLIIRGLLLRPLIITERVWALESPAAE